jgi:hypothetical protein
VWWASCKKKSSSRGLHVETWSGHSSPYRKICHLGGNSNAKHVVKVTNKRLYDLDVECFGTILHNKAKFDCPTDARVTSTDWHRPIVIEDGGHDILDHVTLSRESRNQSGSEKIKTIIKASWVSGVYTEDVDLTIYLTV